MLHTYTDGNATLKFTVIPFDDYVIYYVRKKALLIIQHLFRIHFFTRVRRYIVELVSITKRATRYYAAHNPR